MINYFFEVIEQLLRYDSTRIQKFQKIFGRDVVETLLYTLYHIELRQIWCIVTFQRACQLILAYDRGQVLYSS